MIEHILKNKLSSLEDNLKYRTLQEKYSKNILDFSCNDYLNLSNNHQNLDSIISKVKKYGYGSTGSRLLSGNLPIFSKFESKIAKSKQTEDALIFNSGFQCNVGVLSTITNKKFYSKQPIVFFDKLNHASLYQAIFLSMAKLERFAHNDMQDLENKIAKTSPNVPKIIVTETIFGMDGDLLHLHKIINIAKKFNATLYLDESHATGVLGENGYGLTENVDFKNINHIIMGTFSKALGSIGAYVACSKIIKEFLVNFCPNFIYSTANSPITTYAAYYNWLNLPSMHNERNHLQQLSKVLRQELMKLGFNIGNSNTHIIPLIFKNQKELILVKNKLSEASINTSYIRPPTVPANAPRIRFSLKSSHKFSDIEYLLDVLRQI